MPKNPDVLAGLPRRRRLEREKADLRFIMRSTQILRSPNPTDVELIWRRTGVDVSSLPMANPDVSNNVVCLRVDLDHPLEINDNKVGACDDCGCDIQFRPDLPAGSICLCICCSARRLRKSLDES